MQLLLRYEAGMLCSAALGLASKSGNCMKPASCCIDREDKAIVNQPHNGSGSNKLYFARN